MTERPILFSAPMVQAILAGNKAATRRIVKRKPLLWLTESEFTPDFTAQRENGLSPYGYAGDRLWVRESWYSPATGNECLGYVADDDHPHGVVYRKRPSIHMPRAACRIVLDIELVYIERLQDITPNEAALEGVERTVTGDGWRRYASPDEEEVGIPPCTDARESFRSLWEHINGEQSWIDNPWVWVIEFTRAK